MSSKGDSKVGSELEKAGSEANYVPKKGDIVSDNFDRGIVFLDKVIDEKEAEELDYSIVGLSLERIVERDDELMYKLDSEIQALMDGDDCINRRDVWKIILNAFERDKEGNLKPNLEGNKQSLFYSLKQKRKERDEKLKKLLKAEVYDSSWLLGNERITRPEYVEMRINKVFASVDKEEKK